MKNLQNVVEHYESDRKKRRRYIAALSAMSLLVSFAVPYSMIKPASSLTVSEDVGMQLVSYASAGGIANLNGGEDGNGGYSPGYLSEKALLIGEPIDGNETRDWLAGCTTKEQIIAAAEREYFLGIASDFCVFLEGNFKPEGADSEGRVAVGGNVVFNGSYNYQVGSGDFATMTALKNTDNYVGIGNFAHLIVNGTIENLASLSTVDSKSPYCYLWNYREDASSLKITQGGTAYFPEDEDLYKRFVINSALADSTHITWPKDSGWNATPTDYNDDCEHDPDVLGSNTNEASQFYQASLINFEDAFTFIRNQSKKLSEISETSGSSAIRVGNVLTFTAPAGCTDDVVYFKLSSGDLDDSIEEIRFKDIPDGANIIINYGDEDVKIGSQSNEKTKMIDIYINDVGISTDTYKETDLDGNEHRMNNSKDSERILYNFYNANTVHIEGNMNGTILAPDANVTGDGGAHLSGSLIAKNFEGNVEFGYRPYRGTNDNILGSVSGYGVPVKKFTSDNKPLKDVTFGVFDDDTLVTSFKTDENGEGYVNIPSSVKFDGSKEYTANQRISKTYTIKETSAPLGFIMDDTTTWEIKVEETIDTATCKEIDGKKVPTQVSTVVTIYDDKGNPSETFNIDLKDTYQGSSHTSRQLTIDDNKGSTPEYFIIDIASGAVTAVGRWDGVSTETSMTEVSSWTESYMTTSWTTDVTATDENGSAVTETGVTSWTTDVAVTDEAGNPVTETSITSWVKPSGDLSSLPTHSCSQFGYWGSNATSETVERVTFYYADGSSETTIENHEEVKNEWFTGNPSKNDIVGVEMICSDGVGYSVTWDYKNDTPPDTTEKDDSSGMNRLVWGIIPGAATGDEAEPSEEETPATETKIISWTETTRVTETAIDSWVVTTNVTETDAHYATSVLEYGTSCVVKYDTSPVLTGDAVNTSQTVTVTVPPKQEGGAEAERTLWYDKGSMMLMPLPTNAPTFYNDYGLVFSKVDKDTEALLPGATIVLYPCDASGRKTNTAGVTVLDGKGANNTINLNDLKGSQYYMLKEDAPPAGYEIAEPIYLQKVGDHEVAYSSDISGDWTKIDVTIPGAGIVMEDIKISGAILKLEKTNADFSKSLSGAVFDLYVLKGNEQTLVFSGIEGDANGSFDLYSILQEAGIHSDYVKNGYLQPGSYLLKETTSPTGYNAGGEFRFDVKKDGNDYVIVPKSSTAPAYITFELSSNPSKEVWANGSASNVTKLEIELNSPASGNLELWENAAINGKQPKIEDGVATIEFDPPISLGKFKIQNKNWNDGVDVKEVRVYGEEGAGSGSSSSGGSSSSDATPHEINCIVWNSNHSRPHVDSLTFYYSDKDPQTITGVTFPSGGYWDAFDLGSLNKSNVVGIELVLSGSGSGKLIVQENGTWQNIWEQDVTAGTYTFGVTGNEPPEPPTEPSTEPSGPEPPVSLDPQLKDGDSQVLQIPNSKGGNTIDIGVEKKWIDGGFTELRPEEIEVQLKRRRRNEENKYVEDEEFSKDEKNTLKLKKEDAVTGDASTWEAAGWTGLALYPEGVEETEENAYQYYLVELNTDSHYEAGYSTEGLSGNGTITVSNSLKTIDVEVIKNWVDAEGKKVTAGLPSDIEVQLEMRKSASDNWTAVEGKTLTITADDEWKGKFEDLYEGYEYRVTEKPVTGWDTTITDNVATKVDSTITITNEKQSGSLEVQKTWIDSNNNNRPDSISVDVYRSTTNPNTSGSDYNYITPVKERDQHDNFAKLLQYSLYFYDANMCGSDVSEISAMEWRDDCHTYDNVDGGYHDAGDHVMFGLPQGFTASTLGWSYYEFRDAFDSLGQKEHYQTVMKHFCDFFVDSTKLDGSGNVSDFLYQKGDGGTDHGYWGKPEDQAQGSYGNESWTSAGASNIAADYAAALALYTINFPGDTNNQNYLKVAEALYRFSTKNTGKTASNSFYPDDEDASEQAWAAAWLYIATKNQAYADDCATKLDDARGSITNGDDRGHFWGNVTIGAASVYAMHVNPSDTTNCNFVKDYLDTYCKGNDYRVFDWGSWGAARHNTLLQTTALAFDKNKNPGSLAYADWCKNQMAFLLGDNTIASNGNNSTCFVTGFADNSSRNVHHRAASGYNNGEKGNSTQYSQNGHVLVGALVGGPGSANGGYADEMDGSELVWQTNEVAIDYNAGLVGAAAGLYYFYHTGTTDDATALQAKGIDKPYASDPVAQTPVCDETVELTRGSENETQMLHIGDKIQFALSNTAAESVVWTVGNNQNSNNNAIVSIDDNGILTALSDGAVTVTATANGITAEVVVNVQLSALTVTLPSDRTLVDRLTLQKAQGWRNATLANLPLCDEDGRPYYYYIVETDATTSDDSIKGNNGVVYYPVSYNGNGAVLTNGSSKVFTVTNKTQEQEHSDITMPSAGGTGTEPYEIAGMLLTGGALTYLLTRKRKKEEL